MVKKTGINGIVQTAIDNLNAKSEHLAANLDYIAMMCDVDIPSEEDSDNEQEI